MKQQKKEYPDVVTGIKQRAFVKYQFKPEEFDTGVRKPETVFSFSSHNRNIGIEPGKRNGNAVYPLISCNIIGD